MSVNNERTPHTERTQERLNWILNNPPRSFTGRIFDFFRQRDTTSAPILGIGRVHHTPANHENTRRDSTLSNLTDITEPY